MLHRGPYRLALLLGVVAFALIWVDDLVATRDAGIAIDRPPQAHAYNVFRYSITAWLVSAFDGLAEHGSWPLRGLAVLISAALWGVTKKVEPRRWVQKLALVIFLLVVFQGILGGLRVVFMARLWAQIHGWLGPVFFGSVVGFCVFCSRWWQATGKTEDDNRPRATGLVILSTLMLGLTFGQLVVGSVLRHISVLASPGFCRALTVMHVTTAVVLSLGVLTQWSVCRLTRFKGLGIRRSITGLVLLTLGQVVLGIGTWAVKFGSPAMLSDFPFAAAFVIRDSSFWQMNLANAHLAVGALMLAVWTVHTLRCYRLFYGSRRRDEPQDKLCLPVDGAIDSIATTDESLKAV